MKNIITTITSIIIITTSGIAQKIGIGTTIPVNTLEVVSSVSAGSGKSTSILGTNNGTAGYAVWGNSGTINALNTKGVTGHSMYGWGVQGYSNDSTGISGYTIGGTGLKAISTNGYALQVNGNLKLAGGNTNPSNKAILTSDPTGDATWKKSNIAFLSEETPQVLFAPHVFKKVEFKTEKYDLQNNLGAYNNGTTPSTSSIFTAPVAGVYHFIAYVNFDTSNFGVPNHYITQAQIRLVKNVSANPIATVINFPYNTHLSLSDIDLQISGDFHLNANDKVWVEAMQESSLPITISPHNFSARFSGRLVTAD